MSVLYAPQTTPVLAAMTAARKEREKRFGAPPRYNIAKPKPSPGLIAMLFARLRLWWERVRNRP